MFGKACMLSALRSSLSSTACMQPPRPTAPQPLQQHTACCWFVCAFKCEPLRPAVDRLQPDQYGHVSSNSSRTRAGNIWRWNGPMPSERRASCGNF